MSDYPFPDEIDFRLLAHGWRGLALFEGDLYLCMQGMNVGITDTSITEWEYATVRELVARERTPLDLAIELSAFSQMWIMAVYELMRLWRDRLYKFQKWHSTGALSTAVANVKLEQDEINLPKRVRKRQLERFRDDAQFRERCAEEWARFKPTYEATELLRMNLAKHSAPGRENAFPRAPGYGRIHHICGSMTYEVLDREGHSHWLNRRDIADALRSAFVARDT